MDRAAWLRVRELFEAVVDLDPAARTEVLDERCAADSDTRREVEALLESVDGTTPRPGSLSSAEPETTVPDTVDRYDILRPLGSGGMGTVYLARQSEPIRRDVAIKFIRDGAGSEALLRRFQAERQALASLNHPSIAAVLDAGSLDDGRPYFVMEYVPGTPITDYCSEHRLDRRQRLELLVSVCEALQHAHANGFVHRDIKPSNVLVTEKDDRPVPKIIDFGVAKALEAPDDGDTPRTITGQLVGTPAYMSPEQARGRAVDSRTDLWALGCLVYELETLERPFGGDNVGDTLVAVLSAEVDLTRLRGDTPPSLRRLLRRCLAKEAADRLTSAADARLELLEAMDGSPELEVPGTGWAGRGGSGGHLVLLAMLLLLALAFGFGRGWDTTPAPFARRLNFHVKGMTRLERGAPVIAPDGSGLVYGQDDGLWVRRFDSLEASLIPGTEGGEYPFWSPDSRSVGYFARGALWRVPVEGGEAKSVLQLRGDVVGGAGAAWTKDDEILFSRGNTDLFAVSARGGERSTRYTCPPEVGEHVHGPALLSDGRSVALVVHRAHGPDTIGVLRGAHFDVIYEAPGQRIGRISWSPTGHLVFQRRPVDGGVWAASYSLASGECGPPFLVAAHGGHPTVSDAGTLLFVPWTLAERMELGWVSRAGQWEGAAGAPDRQFRLPRLSPSGDRIAVTIRSQNSYDVWVLDPGQGDFRSRLSFDPGFSTWAPRWSRDGQWIVGHKNPIVTNSAPQSRMWMRRSDGQGGGRDLGNGSQPNLPVAGETLYFDRDGDILRSPIDDLSAAQVFIGGPDEQREPEISPRDDLVAYVSNEGGIWEIVLSALPGGDGKWSVSRGGGSKPRWSSDGGSLYFVQRNSMYEVEVARDPVRVGPAKFLFSGDPLEILLDEGCDVSRDGERFLTIRERRPPGTKESAVLLEDWFAEFRE